MIYLDNFSSMIMDPLNNRRSTGSKMLSCAVTILFGLASLGLGIFGSYQWRKYRHITENQTEEKISKLFRDIFSKEDKEKTAVHAEDFSSSEELCSSENAEFSGVPKSMLSEVLPAGTAEEKNTDHSNKSTENILSLSSGKLSENDMNSELTFNEKRSSLDKEISTIEFQFREFDRRDLSREHIKKAKEKIKGKKYAIDDLNNDKNIRIYQNAMLLCFFCVKSSIESDKNGSFLDTIIDNFGRSWTDEEILELCKKADSKQLGFLAKYYKHNYMNMNTNMNGLNKNIQKKDAFFIEFFTSWHDRFLELDKLGSL